MNGRSDQEEHTSIAHEPQPKNHAGCGDKLRVVSMINKALSKRILGAVLYDAGTWFMSGLDGAYHESKADSGNALDCHPTTK